MSKRLTLIIECCEDCPYSSIQRPTFGHCKKMLKRVRFTFYKGLDGEDRNKDIPDWCPLEDL